MDNYQITNVELIRCACNGHSAFCKIPVLSLFLSSLKGQQRPGCHPTLPPCCDSSLLHLLAPTPIPPPGLPLPITYLSLGCLGVGTPIVNLNLQLFSILNRVSFCNGILNPLSPNIHIQILQTDLHTFPLRISWENLIKDRDIFSLLIILLILITICLDNLWISLGENWCWSLLGLKGLKRVRGFAMMCGTIN